MFVGRSEETAALRAAIAARTPKIALVYGRRRIGKTSLIRQAVGRDAALFIEGLENRPTQAQIASFLSQASHQLRRKLPAATSWHEALMALDKALAGRRMVIVLDEFQWLANYRQELVSTLKMVWENHLSRKPGRTLILCGSIASFMTTKVLKSSAFYGRMDVVVHLQGFRLAETARMLPKRGSQEILDAQCLTGGVPKYLELLSGSPSIALGMEKEAFRADGYFVEEYERIFTSHFGGNSEFQRLIRALAAAPYGLNRRDLAAAAEVDEGGMLSQRSMTWSRRVSSPLSAPLTRGRTHACCATISATRGSASTTPSCAAACVRSVKADAATFLPRSGRQERSAPGWAGPLNWSACAIATRSRA